MSGARSPSASRESLPTPVYGLCHVLIAKLDAEQATWFLTRVSDGENLDGNDPIKHLRDRMTPVARARWAHLRASDWR